MCCFKTADAGFNRREAIFRDEIAMGRYRPIGKFFGAGVRFFHKARLIALTVAR